MKKNRGFTLIETVVGVAVLTTVLIGPIAFLTTAFTRSEASEDKLTGLYLAEEGLELVRRVRDNNVLSGSAWNTGLQNNGTALYEMDFTSNYTTPQSVVAPRKLYFNIGSGVYSYTNDGSPESKFTRIITFNSTLDPNQLRVKSRVEWDNRIVGTHFVELEETLYNWE